MTQWFEKRLGQVDRDRDYDKLRDLTKTMSQWAETLATCVWQLTEKPDNADLRMKCKRIFQTYVLNEDVSTIDTTAEEKPVPDQPAVKAALVAIFDPPSPGAWIDNCALANGAPGSECQICDGTCPRPPPLPARGGAWNCTSCNTHNTVVRGNCVGCGAMRPRDEGSES